MQFYGQFEPPVDRFIFERYFPSTNIQGVFVECGAFDGVLESSCKFFEESMGWRGYNFEPVPWVFDSLKNNRPNSTNLNMALSNNNGEALFKAVIHPEFGRACTNGSIRHVNSHVSLLEEAGCSFENISVSTTTWKNFIETQKISHVDLFVLDVEGHELEVIEGMHKCDILPDVICVEFGHIGIEVIRHRLSNLGYVYDTTDNANAYFVKENRLSLFALRHLTESSSQQKQGEIRVSGPLLEANAVKEENIYLRQRVQELSHLYEEITQSTGWRLVELLRKVKIKARKK